MLTENRFRITWAAARVNKGLTQEEVCLFMQITKPTIINWEKGVSEPRFSQAKKLAELYEVSLDIIRG